MEDLILGIQWDLNNAQLSAGMAAARKNITSTNKSVEELEQQVVGSVNKMAAAFGGILSVGAAKQFIAEMTRVRGEFQQIEVAYSTMLKSRTAASQLMNESVLLAAKTPFGLMDVANSTKQLVAYGVEAKNVTATIEMLGNVASGVGSNIGDIAYLYGTLKTQGRAFQQDINQFTNRGIPIIKELAAQFGVSESKVKGLVEQGKVGFPQIEKAFRSLTSESGIFYNLMREQSKTLTGQLANLGDAWDTMLNNIGKGNEGLISGGIALVTDLIENYEQVVEVVKQLIIVYGAYKAATITTVIIEQTAALGSLSAALKQATGAQYLFNIAGKANPVGLIVAGLTAAVSAFYLYKQSADTAATKTGEIQKEMNRAAFSANSLFDSLKKTKQGTEEHAGAIRLVNERYGKYLDNLLTTKSSLNDIEAAQKRVTSALLADIAVRSGQKKIEESLTDFTDRLESAFDKYAKAFEKAKGADRLQEFWKGLNKAMDQSLAGSGTATQNALKFAKGYLKDIGTLRYDIYDGTFSTIFREVYNKRVAVEKEVNQINALSNSFSKDFIAKSEEPQKEIRDSDGKNDKDAEKKESERQKKITDDLKKELDERSQAFERYADFVKRVNREEADARYGNDTEGFADFHKYAQSKLDGLLKGRDPMTLDKYEYERYDAIIQKNAEMIQKSREAQNEAYAKEYEDQKEQYKKLLETVITYDQSRKNLTAEFEKNKALLLSEGKDKEARILQEKYNEELGQLDDSNVQKLQSYKDLFEGINQLTDAGARDVISKAKALLSSDTDMSPELRQKIEKALGEATESLNKRLPERVMMLADSFGQMGQEISKVNEELGSMLTGVGNVLAASVQIGTNFSDLSKGLKNYKAWKEEKNSGNASSGAAGILGGISAIAGVAGQIGGIVSAVAGVASGVFKFFGAAKESARQAEKQLREYQQKIIDGELEYGRLIRERARGQKEVNEMTLAELATQKELLKTQLETARVRDLTYKKVVGKDFLGRDIIKEFNKQEVLSDYDYALQKILSEGTEVTGQRKEKYGGFLGMGKKTRLVDITASLAGKTYEDLEKLYTEGKMNDSTKAMFENLQKTKLEIEDIKKLEQEIDELIMDKMSGSATASGISSSIIQGFRDGKRAVVDFAGDMEEIVQEALLSAMSATVLEEPLQELVKSFRENSKDGLSENEIEEFKKAYGDVVQSGLEAMKEIDRLTEGKIGSSSSSNIQSEGISRVSEHSAMRFTGIEKKIKE